MKLYENKHIKTLFFVQITEKFQKFLSCIVFYAIINAILKKANIYKFISRRNFS